MILHALNCLAVLSFTLMAVDAHAEPAATKEAAEKTIAAALDPFVTDGQLAGYVTVLIKDGKPVATNVQGHADIATQRPLTKDSIFRIFSMTKPVTGVALMILHDRDKWKFSDPIAKFLPELANLRVYRSVDAAGNLVSAPATAQPTMGQLVTHSAGFLYGFGTTPLDQEYQKHIPPLPTTTDASSYLAALAKIPLAYEPGTQWQYSIAMDLEGIIIARLSGKSLQAFMKTEIFDPLGMVDTDFVVPPKSATASSRFTTCRRAS
jgi:CubicO group peptidase (beta-lactamase class C family)